MRTEWFSSRNPEKTQKGAFTPYTEFAECAGKYPPLLQPRMSMQSRCGRHGPPAPHDAQTASALEGSLQKKEASQRDGENDPRAMTWQWNPLPLRS